MKSNSKLILEYLKKKKGWVFGGTLEREIPTISKPSTVSRVLREMAESELILKDYKLVNKIRCVVYKFKKCS